MAKTNWQDPKTSEMRSTHVAGLMEAVGKIEDSIGMESVFETNIPLTEVFISSDDRYRIFQAPEGKRNWTAEQPPVIKRNGVTISSGFEIDYGGGAIILNVNDTVANAYTADVKYVKKLDENLYGLIRKHHPDDTSGSPGSEFLIAGTMEEGFFGEVLASELITGDALASECGISQGTSQFSTEPWLKFAYKGEILFVAKKPIRHSISWNAINTAKCVYGDSGDKTVVIDGKTYKVTLMRALEPSNDPKTVASGSSGAVNHHSEWNRLICQIHEEAINGSWGYPNNIESDIGILEHSLGSGSQGMYSDADLIVASGDGRLSWCQEMSTSTTYRLGRGALGVSHSSNHASSNVHSSSGWRPVLRLVEED
jgi:hypothetical protein